MKKRLTAYTVLFVLVLSYLLNCSFTENPYGIEDAGISQTQIATTVGVQPLPSYYSSFDEGYLSPAADQGTTEICWAFTHNELLTANVAKKTGEVYDFSEQTMKFETSHEENKTWGYTRGVNDGGNEIMSTAYLARSGSVLEIQEPFNEGKIRTVNPDTLTRYGYLKNTEMYDYGIYDTRANSGYPPEDVEKMRHNKTAAIQKIKELVYENGAVGAGIYYEYSSLYENSTKTGYYYNGNRSSPNHSVTIVGWDDSYSKNNFSQTPEGDGAFIIKNSWGNYHDNGTSCYFYISYYDKFITYQLFASEYEFQNELYDNMYQYDGYGWTNNGYVDYPSILCISRFSASKVNESVSAVSTYIAEGDTVVDVYINTGGDLTNKNAYTKVSTEYFDAPGYYLMEFDEVALKKAEYYVALRLTTGRDQTQFAIQTNAAEVCPDAQNTPDTCYIGDEFNRVIELENVYKSYEPMHCIKSFTVSNSDTTQPSGKSFFDVNPNKWYADEIEYCVARNIFSGVSDTEFKPETAMTRAMFVKVLANLSGDRLSNYSTPFTDLEAGRWYESAVGWAYQNGIVSGITKTTFEPNSYVTREQICFMLTKFADYMGIDFREIKEPITFTDSGSVSKYAKPAVSACQRASIVNGMPDGSFAPKKSATRADVAVMLTGLCKNYIY